MKKGLILCFLLIGCVNLKPIIAQQKVLDAKINAIAIQFSKDHVALSQNDAILFDKVEGTCTPRPF
jgi:hypothetical protein